MKRSRKRIVAISMLLAISVVRELGWIDWRACTTSSSSQSKRDSHSGPNTAVTLEDQARYAGEEPYDMPGGCVVHVRVDRSAPWSRWIPLFKTGTVTLNRTFMVTQGNLKILEGVSTYTRKQTTIGSISARGFVQMAEVADVQEFDDWLGKQIAQRARRLQAEHNRRS